MTSPTPGPTADVSVRVGWADDAPGIATKYGIRSVPTVLVFKNGEKTAQNVGLTTRDKLVGLLGV